MVASRSFVIISLLAIFALSGTILLDALTYKDVKRGILQPAPPPSPPLPTSTSVHEQVSRSCGADEAMLKVYMYDLPAEYHFGMLEERKLKDERFFSREAAAWPDPTRVPRYPGGLYQQHSPEYWLTADLLSSTSPSLRNSSCTAVRVRDPDAADVFFVPFFSSLSYNRYCRVAQKSCVEENDRLERRLVAHLTRQPTWKKNGGVDHVIVMHHPNSLRVARNLLKEAMFVVADFGRYSESVANLRKDVVAPYKHVVPTFTNDSTTFDSRKTLLFFQGAIVRKEGGVIRQQLYELVKDHPEVHFTTGNTQREGIRSAAAGMRGSKFCLHLAGDTPSSNRLFDAIASHCVPVIISDDIELPFEDTLDYSQFSIFIESEKALKKDYVLKLLRKIGPVEWTRMWKRLKEVDKHFEYQYPTLDGDAVHMTWKAIARRLPGLHFLAHKKHRYD